jgi:dolichol-phosphate mannosyltransferase
MDGDLQDPPEEIPKLYGKFKEGYDVVYAIRDKKAEPFLKKAASWLYIRILRKVSSVDIDVGSGIFRIMSRRCVYDMRRMKEKSRFIAGMVSWLGYSTTGVVTTRHERYAGTSKYTVLKLITLAWHGITAFSSIPLKSTTYFGFIVALLSFLYGGYWILKKIFYGSPVPGFTSLMVSLFFLGGLIRSGPAALCD